MFGVCLLIYCYLIWQVPESCPAGSFLENVTFEVSDSDGLIDESIDGPLHTLNITSNELPLVEGAQYAIKHGRCVLSRVQLPHEQGTVTIVACHTSYPDLQIKIQVSITCKISGIFYANVSNVLLNFNLSSFKFNLLIWR